MYTVLQRSSRAVTLQAGHEGMAEGHVSLHKAHRPSDRRALEALATRQTTTRGPHLEAETRVKVDPTGGGDARPCEAVVAHSDLEEALVVHGVHRGRVGLARHHFREEIADVQGELVKERRFEGNAVALALGARHAEVA